MSQSLVFDVHFEIATSHDQDEPDQQSITAICMTILNNDVTPQYVMQKMKIKFSEKPKICILALMILEQLVEDCGDDFHEEVFNKENCEMFATLAINTQDLKLRNKILQLIEIWCFCFRATQGGPKITMNLLIKAGFRFPQLMQSLEDDNNNLQQKIDDQDNVIKKLNYIIEQYREANKLQEEILAIQRNLLNIQNRIIANMQQFIAEMRTRNDFRAKRARG